MKVNEFIMGFKSEKIMNTRIDTEAVSKYIRNKLEVKNYVPFRQKRNVVEIVVAQNTKEIDGIKKNDPISQYVSFVTSMLVLHTNLEFSEDPITDYDLLAESGLLPQIIEEFKQSYDECDILLKMALASELEDNNVNVLVGKFLNDLLNKLDGLGVALKDALGAIDIKDVLGANFKEEDLAKLSGFLNRYNK